MHNIKFYEIPLKAENMEVSEGRLYSMYLFIQLVAFIEKLRGIGFCRIEVGFHCEIVLR
jgi:hypothetical protein